jgi:hypothetical protein
MTTCSGKASRIEQAKLWHPLEAATAVDGGAVGAGQAKSQCSMEVPYLHQIISVRILICINKKFDLNQSFISKAESRLF